MCSMIALSDCLYSLCTARCQALPALALCVTEKCAGILQNWAGIVENLLSAHCKNMAVRIMHAGLITSTP